MSLLFNLRRLLAQRRVYANVSSSLERVMSTAESKGMQLQYERDPQPLFIDAETQKLLKSMTQLQLQKLFRKRTTEDNTMEYKFMTTEEVENAFREAIQNSHKRLQMPPVVRVKTDTTRIISQDNALKDFADSKFVITDITFGVRETERKVLVRQTDGTLEYAPLDVTKRMRQIYFPLKGRSIYRPRMFEPEHFKRCLDEQKYEFILDRLAVQYEPYEQEYHELTSQVYQHINETKQFDVLRSTRHFGPMAFFYAWHRIIDDLLYDMIKRDYLRNGVELIALMHKIHGLDSNYETLLQQLDRLLVTQEELAMKEALKPLPSGKDDIHEEISSAIGKNAQHFEADELCLQFIHKYIETQALKKVQLELAVQTLKEINIEKKQLYEGLNKAHGVQQNE